MIRIIVQTDDCGMACNVGGRVVTQFRTFDVELPAVEAFLREPQGGYGKRQVIGICFVPEEGREP